MKQQNHLNNEPLVLRYYRYAFAISFDAMSEFIQAQKLNDDEYTYLVNSKGYHIYVIESRLTQAERKFHKLNF